MAGKILLAALLVLSVVTYAQADHGSSVSDGGRDKRSATSSQGSHTLSKRSVSIEEYPHQFLKTSFLRLLKDVPQADTATFNGRRHIWTINVGERPWVPDSSGKINVTGSVSPPCYEIKSPGLSGTPGSVSIQHLTPGPQSYAHASDGLVKMTDLVDTEAYRKCASFFMFNDLWGQCCGCVVFRSECFPDQFIRHQGYILKHGPYEENDLYLDDSTFKFTECVVIPQ